MGTYVYRAIPKIHEARLGGEIVTFAVFSFVGNPVSAFDPKPIQQAWNRLQKATEALWLPVTERPAFLVHINSKDEIASGSPVYSWDGKKLFFSDGSGEINIGPVCGLLVKTDSRFEIEDLQTAHLYIIAPNQHKVDFYNEHGTYYLGAKHFEKWLINRGAE